MDPSTSSIEDDVLSSPDPPDEQRIVKHIMVIGFHHKHGYQVDYCYPPLEDPQNGGQVFPTPNKPITLPSCWKTLPLLCLPDGSHNYGSDTIYFTMPDRDQPTKNEFEEDAGQLGGIKTIFGTACFRQIQADKLLNRTDDMTRFAVQKSVCILSTRPLFGLIRSKLELITHAYFEELDFSKVRILKLTYDNLNSLLSRESVRENATFLGLSARHLVSHFNCNVLVLFKAMLLEKKILFYKTPVRDLCSTIMSMCSLFCGLLECDGLDYSTCDLQLSANLLEALKLLPTKTSGNEHSSSTTQSNSVDDQTNESRVFFSPSKEQVVIMNNNSETKASESTGQANHLNSTTTDEDKSSENLNNTTDNEFEIINQSCETKQSSTNKTDLLDDQEALAPGEASMDETVVDDLHAHKLCQAKPEDCGLPLQIFTRGSFCLPYLSITYLDLLSDKRVRSFVIGATNFLFKQKREMYDVIVDMEANSIIINDLNLKKLLTLTIEDLRFMDYIMKHVKVEKTSGENSTTNEPQISDAFDPFDYDITKWLGGDEWIRYHFRIYTLYLLKAAKSQTNLDLFNSGFVQTWKSSTNNYRIWDSTGKASILDGLQARHPFGSPPGAKRINFNDVKLKFSYAVNSSEKGRIVNQALNGIGRWSIWNNIASAGNLAATTVSTLATSAAAQTIAVVSPQQQQSTAANSSGPTGGRSHEEDQQSDLQENGREI